MGRYLAGRVASAVFLLFAVTFFVFVAFSLVPSRTGFRGPFATQDLYQLHGSMTHQYAGYVWNIVRHGNLGRSYSDRESVTSVVLRAAPVTLALVLGGVVVSLLIAVPLGLLTALHPRSVLDRAATVLVLIGVCSHPVWLGLMSGFLLGEHWHVFPSSGYCDLFSPATACGGLAQWSYHLVLPWLVFGFLNAAFCLLMVRGIVIEELDKDYVRAARAKGAGETRIVRVHVLKNAMLPITTIVGVNIGIAIGGIIFIESAFGLPGLGGLFRRSIIRHDIPMTAGIVLFMSVAIIAINLVVDLVYLMLDPRIRYTGERLQPAKAPA